LTSKRKRSLSRFVNVITRDLLFQVTIIHIHKGGRMNKRYKTCSSCVCFLKFKNDSIGGGLCEKTDGRTHADNHLNCKHWKGKRYIRRKVL